MAGDRENNVKISPRSRRHLETFWTSFWWYSRGEKFKINDTIELFFLLTHKKQIQQEKNSRRRMRKQIQMILPFSVHIEPRPVGLQSRLFKLFRSIFARLSTFCVDSWIIFHNEKLSGWNLHDYLRKRRWNEEKCVEKSTKNAIASFSVEIQLHLS